MDTKLEYLSSYKTESSIELHVSFSLPKMLIFKLEKSDFESHVRFLLCNSRYLLFNYNLEYQEPYVIEWIDENHDYIKYTPQFPILIRISSNF